MPDAAIRGRPITLEAIHPEWRAAGMVAIGVVSTALLERLIRPWLLRTTPGGG